MYGEAVEDNKDAWRKEDRKRRDNKHPNFRQKVQHVSTLIIMYEYRYIELRDRK